MHLTVDMIMCSESNLYMESLFCHCKASLRITAFAGIRENDFQ